VTKYLKQVNGGKIYFGSRFLVHHGGRAAHILAARKQSKTVPVLWSFFLLLLLSFHLGPQAVERCH
jgi:hypothetical protein